MAASIPELVALERDTSPNTFTSRHNPLSMGNAADIAYGGCAVAFAVNAAMSTVTTDTHRIYSAMGHFLSGARNDRPLHAIVTRIRDTKAFATRSILVTQTLDDKSTRAVLSVLVDFHRREPADLLTFSVPPPKLAGPVSESWDRVRTRIEMEKLPGSSPALVKRYEATFAPVARFFEQRAIPQSVAAQNMFGVLKRAPTSQDGLPLTEKRSCDWFRARADLKDYAEHISTLAWQMDGAISFIPLTHSGMFLQDSAACSSLDFALRVFDNDLNMNSWHLREIGTVAGSGGRTYGVARLFGEDGRLVAEMSQQCILRPHRGKAANL